MLSMPETNFQAWMAKNSTIGHFVTTAELPPYEIIDVIFNLSNRFLKGEPVSDKEFDAMKDFGVTTPASVMPSDRSVSVRESSITLTFISCGAAGTTYVATPKGTQYPACKYPVDDPLSTRNSNDSKAKTMYPSATLIRNTTRLRQTCFSVENFSVCLCNASI